MPQAATKLKPIHATRQRNLVAQIKNKFEGNSSECARVIERSHAYMWQLVRGYRAIGENSARHIERAMGLAPNALDVAKPQRTKELQASDASGNMSSYRMVPMLPIGDLDAKPTHFVPCPLPGQWAKMICTRIEARDRVEIEEGDVVFVDCADVELQQKKFYLVRRTGLAACVLMAHKVGGEWRFAASRPRTEEWPARSMKVLGRVVLVIRQLRHP